MTRKKENWVCALANTGCLKQGNVIIQLHYFTLFYRRKEREKKKEGVKHKEKRNSRSLSSNLCNMAHASSCKIAFPFFGLDNLLMFSFYFHLGWYRRRRRRYRHFQYLYIVRPKILQLFFISFLSIVRSVSMRSYAFSYTTWKSSLLNYFGPFAFSFNSILPVHVEKCNEL